MNEINSLPRDYDELDKLAADTTGSICWICHRFESFNGEEPYIVCFECGHVYHEPQDLVDSYEKEVEWKWEESPDQIPFCPECLHDF